eukprot:CAMPEP_0198733208 /NCGR_PEP_ID=MMETSP1475-20131203/43656_1 /TAXON_ID= ORGANISM="Unidentified sp., Strain CCMP1999" /NCGR_SAMPLE_ID=MMETSP1475 /ASSEMBLY_ACC=CAM_ASM_001111 /LENGTH=523 /DNA_ID=CAMNT_0044496465 /DNA_START=131 /DNA_END=1702 /DNA_ORIENTATION=+
MNVFDELSDADRRSALLMLNKQRTFQHRFVSRFFAELVQTNRAKTIHYNIFMRRMGIERAMETFYDMIQRGVQPDIATLNLLAMKAGQARSVKTMKKIEDYMEVNDIPKDITFYAHKLSIFAMDGKIEDALRVVEKIREDGLQPTEQIFAWSIRTYALAGESEKAMALYEDLKSKGLANGHLVTQVAVKAVIQAGDLTKAREILKYYRLAQKRDTEAVAFNLLVDEIGRRGDETELMEVVDDMKKNGPSPTAGTYAPIILFYGLRNNMPKVDETHHELKLRRISRSNWYVNHLLFILSRNGLRERTSNCYEMMRQAGPRPSKATAYIMLHHFATLGDFDRVEEVWQDSFEMRRMQVTADHYKVLFFHYGQRGGAYVQTLWRQMKEEPGLWVEKSVFEVLLDIATHYEMKDFRNDVQACWNKVCELYEKDIDVNEAQPGFSFFYMKSHAMNKMKADAEDETGANTNLIRMIELELSEKFGSKVPRKAKLENPERTERFEMIAESLSNSEQSEPPDQLEEKPVES